MPTVGRQTRLTLSKQLLIGTSQSRLVGTYTRGYGTCTPVVSFASLLKPEPLSANHATRRHVRPVGGANSLRNACNSVLKARFLFVLSESCRWLDREIPTQPLVSTITTGFPGVLPFRAMTYQSRLSCDTLTLESSQSYMLQDFPESPRRRSPQRTRSLQADDDLPDGAGKSELDSISVHGLQRQGSLEYTFEEERLVLRKFDRHLVLFIALLYMLAFLDRSSM